MAFFRTQRWLGTPPDADPARKAVVLPGRAYPVELPGLWTPMRVLALAGWDVWHAAWDLTGVAPDAVAQVVDDAIAEMGEGARLVVGKSLGSRAAGWAADRAVPAIWLTPLLTDPAVAEDISRSPAPALLVAGDADHTWDDAAARATGKQLLRLGPLNHGLVGGDVHRELAALGTIADAVAAFVADLDPAER